MYKNNDMTVDEHLGELRKRLIWILVALTVTMIIGFAVAGPVINFFRQLPEANGMHWNMFSRLFAIWCKIIKS